MLPGNVTRNPRDGANTTTASLIFVTNGVKIREILPATVTYNYINVLILN